jgi:hypothetical protein
LLYIRSQLSILLDRHRKDEFQLLITEAVQLLAAALSSLPEPLAAEFSNDDTLPRKWTVFDSHNAKELESKLAH